MLIIRSKEREPELEEMYLHARCLGDVLERYSATQVGSPEEGTVLDSIEVVIWPDGHVVAIGEPKIIQRLRKSHEHDHGNGSGGS